jgi:hypothetical protein
VHLLQTKDLLNNKIFFMKKLILAALALSLSAKESKACDICGCGAGNSYIGILPDFNFKIFGMRYRYNHLRSHIGAGGVTTYLTTNESYRTAELWGGWNIGKRFRLMASLPYNFAEKATLTSTVSKNGIGDISLSGFYSLINNRKNIADKLLVQSLWIGGGVKLATGKYEAADKSSNNQNANLFQLGTASTDFSLNMMYDVRLNDAGINVAAAYKMNTENKFDYQYGNKITLNSQAYYKFRIKNKVMLAPNAGMQFESSKKDFDKGFDVDISGGNLLMGTAGLEVSYRKISAGINLQTPFSQSLGALFIKAENRGMVHVSFIF